MTDLKTDAEKAEDIKQWWKENGTSVVTGVALAIASVIGWQQWQEHKQGQAEEASALFAQQQKQPNAEKLAKLKTEADSSPYAALAALNAAKQAAEQGNNEQAKAELEWAIDHSSDELLKQVARLHLARLAISSKDFKSANSILGQPFSPAYSPLVEELKGDLYLAQNQPEDAAKSYRQAIQLSGGNSPRYLQMKLDNLGNTSTNSTAKNGQDNKGA